MNLEDFIKHNGDAFNDKKMPQKARGDFEKRLKSELHNSSGTRKLSKIAYLSIAASIVMLLSIGYVFTNQPINVEPQNDLVASLDKPQTNSERLETIYEIEDQLQFQKEDEQILKAFYKILNEDSDPNSKIAVIDALLNFPNNQDVRTQLINALEHETEPLVQLKLIKSVAILREQRAKEPLQKIINDNESLPLVKGNASELLAMLNQ